MLSKEGAQNLFNDVNRIWIAPELQRRWPNGPPDDFKIRRCLIRMPVGAPAIVEFNDEIGWLAEVKVGEHTASTEGQPVYLADIEHIRAVQPPEVDGKRVAFIYVFQTKGPFHSIIFDATPNAPDIEPPAEADQWELGKHIAEHLQSMLAERAVSVPDGTIAKLVRIGLWPAPSLLPNPLTRIVQTLEIGAEAAARALLVQHCTPDFLGRLVAKWDNVRAFKHREELFRQALQAHRDGNYALAIYSLLPQVEGVITDWLLTKIPEVDVPFRQESKTKKFRDLLATGAVSSFTERRVAETVINFILDGPVLKQFKQWNGAIDELFPGRHIMGHGRYDVALTSEENSIKVFLLLDTLWSLVNNV